MDIHQSLIIANKKTSGSQELTTHIFNQEDSRHKFASMVILHDYSLSIVEQVGFRKFIASLQPCFNMISRNTLRSDILKIYNVQRAKCYKLLDKLNCRIAITTDMWISNNTKKDFMAITGHYIDDSWILQHCILRYNIDHKVSTIMIDNCTTNNAILHLLLDKLSKRDILLNGKLLICLCDSIVFWTTSLARVEKFKEVARQLHISCSKKLSLDCKTHWNSTYLILETTIIYKYVFSRVKYWVNVIEMYGKLKFFYHVTEMFFGKLTLLNFIFQNFSLNMMIHCMAEKMLEKYEKYWDACHIMMGVAAVLDLRYKLKLVEFCFPLIYGERSQSKVDEIRQNCYDLLVDYKSRAATLNENSSSFSSLGIKMERDILVIPVSTIAFESVFSISKRMVSPHHSRLHPTTLEALMCAHRWLWNEVKGTCSTLGGISTCPTMLDEQEDDEELTDPQERQGYHQCTFLATNALF
ncbi:hypothetical protein Pfo_022472 [Paulownia fortunei]|nr:hypothetical protein Pfo_022472 [Paulownia fortunei]